MIRPLLRFASVAAVAIAVTVMAVGTTRGPHAPVAAEPAGGRATPAHVSAREVATVTDQPTARPAVPVPGTGRLADVVPNLGPSLRTPVAVSIPPTAGGTTAQPTAAPAAGRPAAPASFAGGVVQQPPRQVPPAGQAGGSLAGLAAAPAGGAPAARRSGPPAATPSVLAAPVTAAGIAAAAPGGGEAAVAPARRSVGSPHYVNAVGSSPGTFDVNAYLGTAAWGSWTGTAAKAANIEGGHPRMTHEALSVYNVGGVVFSGTGALNLPPSQQDHATGTSFTIAGRLAAGGSAAQSGIASIAAGNFFFGNIALSFGMGGSFSTTYTSERTAYQAAMIDGINGNPANVVDVINGSWGRAGDTDGSGSDFSRYQDALLVTANATRGVSIVASAGNSGPGTNTVGFPGSGYNTISVGAVGPLLPGHVPYNNVSGFSSRGPQVVFVPNDSSGATGTTFADARIRVDLVAPGQSVYLATGTGDTAYRSWDGTSFSAPTVAGAVARMADFARGTHAGNPSLLRASLDSRVVRAVLMNSADQTAGWSNAQSLSSGTWTTGQSLDPAAGAGRLNLTSLWSQFADAGVSLDPAAGSTVNPAGWANPTTSATAGSTQTFTFTGTLAQYTDLATTLTWFVDRGIDLSTGTTTERSFFDLDLRVWQLSGPGGTQVAMVGQSNSAFNTAEHLSFLIPQAGTYQIEVLTFGDNWDFFSTTSVPYGLAWLARPSTVTTAGDTPVASTATTPNVLIAPAVGQTASVTVSGSSTVYTVNNNLFVGGDDLGAGGTGTLTVSGGATVRVNNRATVFGGSQIVLDGSTLSVGVLDLRSGATVTSSGTSTLGATPIISDGGSILATGGVLGVSSFVDWNGDDLALLTLQGGTTTVGGAGQIDLFVPVTGAGALLKTGTGDTYLRGPNSFTGGTTVSGGRLIVGDSATSGTLPGNSVNNAEIGFFRSNTYTHAGNISGTGFVTNYAGGTIVLTGTNTYAGNTRINAGTVRVGSAGAIPTGAGRGNVVLNAGASAAGTFDLGGFSLTINGLSGTAGTVLGQVINSTPSTTATLTVGNADTTSSFAGLIRNNAGSGGTVALTKVGAGTLTLTGASTYTGGTTVNAGTLLVNNTTGSGTGDDGVTVSGSTAVLGGTGFVTGPVVIQNSGTLSPGTSVGTFHVTGDATVAAGTFRIELGSAFDTLSPNANNNVSDQLAVTSGDLGFVTGTVFDVRSAGQTFAPNLTYRYTIGIVSGGGSKVEFNGSLFNGTITGATNDGRFLFDYASPASFSLARAGDNLVLEFTPVPEPLWVTGVFAAGLGGAAWVRRRRRTRPATVGLAA